MCLGAQKNRRLPRSIPGSTSFDVCRPFPAYKLLMGSYTVLGSPYNRSPFLFDRTSRHRLSGSSKKVGRGSLARPTYAKSDFTASILCVIGLPLI